MAELQVQYIDPQELKPFADNPRQHSERNIQDIQRSIKKFGFTNPILVRQEDNMVVAGHGRLQSAQELGLDEVPVIYLDFSENDAKLYAITDNRTAETSEWDLVALDELVQSLEMDEDELPDTGFYADELEEILAEIDSTSAPQGEEQAEVARQTLAQRFLVPPFSVLDARQGYWQERKRAWLALGIQSELGRGVDLLKFSDLAKEAGGARLLMAPTTGNTAAQAKDLADRYGRDEQALAHGGLGIYSASTSIFDPVLCELAYRWFCPPGGSVLDPFAGGSVRGIVAAKLGRRYVGVDLSGPQLEANRQQAETMLDELRPEWIQGDSRQALPPGEFDFVFSCPPYFDLEVYSEEEGDISNMDYPDFLTAYRDIISQSCQRLKDDRLACFVVGEVRDKKGNYHNLIGDTVQAFLEAGLTYYNEAILVTSLGSLPIRAARMFSAGRKLGKTHQNVLVFLKGDAKQAVEALGEVALDESIFNQSEPLPETASAADGQQLLTV